MSAAPPSALPFVARVSFAAVLLVAIALALLPALVAIVVASPLVIVAVVALWQTSRIDAELDAIGAWARRCRVERDRVVRPTPAPVARSMEGRSLLSRIDGVERLVARAEEDVQASVEESARSQSLRARFTAAMGHEIKTPLSSIAGFATMIERRAPGELTVGQRESIVMIRRGAQDLLRLLSDLLDSAKLDVGRLVLRRALVPSVSVLTEAVKEARAVVEARPITIESTLQPGLPPIRVDSARLVQAIVAVVRHAARGISSGKLELGARLGRGADEATELHVEIRDASRVLTAEEVDRVFVPFRASRTPEGGRPGGLGLALSLARRIAQLHGGDVSVESDEANGTRFVVAVPIDY